MTDDPAILSTTAIGMLIGAFALLRALATERQRRIDLINATLEAHRARQEQPAPKP